MRSVLSAVAFRVVTSIGALCLSGALAEGLFRAIDGDEIDSLLFRHEPEYLDSKMEELFRLLEERLQSPGYVR